MTQYAPAAVTDGAVTEADLDVLLRRLFRVRIRLGQFNPPGPLSNFGPEEVGPGVPAGLGGGIHPRCSPSRAGLYV